MIIVITAMMTDDLDNDYRVYDVANLVIALLLLSFTIVICLYKILLFFRYLHKHVALLILPKLIQLVP